MHNLVTITIHPRKFDFKPPCPEVRALVDDFVVVVNWNRNSDWSAITLQNFQKADGTPVAIEGGTVRIENGTSVARVKFVEPVWGSEFFCKYEVAYTPAGGGADYIVDPTLIIRPTG